MPHGARGQGVQDGDGGDAPPMNPLHTYQKVGAEFGYPAITFWAGAGNGFNDILTAPTSTKQAANIGSFVRGHQIETVAKLFRVVGEAGKNLFEQGMHMKAMHTDGQDVPLLHVRLDMEQKEGVLWPASTTLTTEHQEKMICLAFQSLLNAPWTLKQLNAAWANDLRPNVAHLSGRFGNFFAGFRHDQVTDGPFQQLLAGKWDGSCPSSLPIEAFSGGVIVALVCGVIVFVAVMILKKWEQHKTHAREPLLEC